MFDYGLAALQRLRQCVLANAHCLADNPLTALVFGLDMSRMAFSLSSLLIRE
jgi:hypothetical protein